MTPPTSWTTTPITTRSAGALVRGALELEPTGLGVLPHRLPRWARARGADAQLLMAESQPSGVRLVLRTRATVVELDTLPTKRVYAGMGPRPDGVYDLLVDGRLHAQATAAGGRTLTLDLATGATSEQAGPVATVTFAGLPDRVKDVEVWLPHDETTELVALRTDAPLEEVGGPPRRRWLHHGSSISQGSNAASPSTTWPALAARAGGVELTNLGFGGGALLDPSTARVLRDTPADLLSVAVGINLVNTDAMRLRAFVPAVHGFLDTVRDGHPDAPLLVVTPLLCPIHEDTPGPSAPEVDPATGQVRFRATGDPAERAAGRLTLRVVRDALTAVVEQRRSEDPHLHLLDGLTLYGKGDAATLPLPDRLHPDAATHRLVGERFAEQVFGTGGPFGDR